jgi:hypothetical protein
MQGDFTSTEAHATTNNSEAAHTPEPWEVDDKDGVASIIALTREAWVVVATVEHLDEVARLADARRIADCVNALKGVPLARLGPDALRNLKQAHATVSLWKQRQVPMSVDSLMAAAQLSVLEWFAGDDDRFAETLKRMERDVGGAWPRPGTPADEAASFAELPEVRVSEPDQSHLCGDCDRYHSPELPCTTPADEAWANFGDQPAEVETCPLCSKPLNGERLFHSECAREENALADLADDGSDTPTGYTDES